MKTKSKAIAAIGAVYLLGSAPAAFAQATTDPTLDTAVPADDDDGDEGKLGLLGLAGLLGLLGLKRRDRHHDHGVHTSTTAGRH